ncbi:MAG TPA: hypothetical protein VLM36_02695 [Sphingomicrobium sp.]|jgi:hypothetical protein|nr:hypothetical protein [Sphingomicrobium sp.]
MQLARPVVALDPKLFGRGRARVQPPPPLPAGGISSDLKLFATTFVAGFLFVSILIG